MKDPNRLDPAALKSGNVAAVDIGISEDPEDQLMILNVLSSTLYTDKIAAVLREYGCNAFDANVEAGKGDVPIEVRLPNKLDPSVSIRDQGAGMNGEQVRSIFCKMGRSTKRTSNAFTGMLGIGSKAGFAYGDSFMVTSFADGKKTIYNCFRDKGVPRMAEMYSEDTTEADGVEVKVPVRQQDINDFIIKAERIFRYFKVRPKVTGAELKWVDNEAQFKGTGWRYTGAGRSVAIMGNVGYDLTTTAMGYDTDAKVRMLIESGIELNFEIGDLEIAASREGLQYKEHTKKAIAARLKIVIDEVSKVFVDTISKAPSYWEACQLYASSFERTGGGAQRAVREIIDGKVTWQGKPITTGRIDIEQTTAQLNSGDYVRVVEYWKAPYYTRTQKRLQPHEIHAAKDTYLIVNDLDSGNVSHTRVRGFFETHPGDNIHMVIFTGEKRTLATFWKDKNLTGAPTILFSTIPKPVAPVITSGGGGISAHRSKHSAKVFTFNTGNKTNRDRWTQSTWWNLAMADLANDSGVYVEIDQFRVAGAGSYQNCESFCTIVENAQRLKLLTTPVFGFKRDKLDKLGGGWKLLNIHLQEQIDNLNNKTFAQELADYKAVCAYKELFDAKHQKLLPAGTIARKLVDEVVRMRAPKASKELIEYIQTDQGKPWITCPVLPKASVDLQQLELDVINKYPLLQFINDGSYYKKTAACGIKTLQNVVDYIDLVESAK